MCFMNESQMRHRSKPFCKKNPIFLKPSPEKEEEEEEEEEED